MTRLCVNNLASVASDEDLRELFAQYGAVDSATVVVDKNTGRRRGYAFVEMSSGAREAVRAIHGSRFQGATLSVDEARPVKNAPRVYPV